MKTINNTMDCLSYKQLYDYCNKKINGEELKNIYIHLSGCDLCAGAITGFGIIPFTENEIGQLNAKIDSTIKPTYTKTFLRILMAAASVCVIIGFYKFTNSFSEPTKEKETVAVSINKVAEQAEKQITLSFPAVNVSKIKKEGKQVCNIKPIDTINTSVGMEPLKGIAVSLNNFFINGIMKNGIKKPTITDDVMYIEDLKVVDYKKIYFYHPSTFTDLFDNTPASSENNKTNSDLNQVEKEHKITTCEVLKKGLHYFKQQKYGDAFEEFQVLLENNKNDVNAMFYGGICNSEMGYYSSAINNFKAVLNYPNHQFDEEAKWELALTYLKVKDTANAQILFQEIVDEDGFYSKKAQEELGRKQ